MGFRLNILGHWDGQPLRYVFNPRVLGRTASYSCTSFVW
jgi:hypothetical protein